MTSFIFVRHGKSQANLEGDIATSDSPLAKEGASQARKAGRELRGKGIAVIVTSPYPRARETAEIIAKELKIDNIEVVDDLRERGLGSYEGRKKEEASEYYFTVDGKDDVEPRGVLIARCEAVLSKIKKLSEQGKVLAVGHSVSGFYLQQVAGGKRLVDQFDTPKVAPNARPVTVAIREPQRPSISKDAALAIGAVILGLAALVIGIVLMLNRPAELPQNVKQQSIPLRPEDYNDDPNLQGAIQKLQGQQQSTQAESSASNALQPNQGLGQ